MHETTLPLGGPGAGSPLAGRTRVVAQAIADHLKRQILPVHTAWSREGDHLTPLPCSSLPWNAIGWLLDKNIAQCANESGLNASAMLPKNDLTACWTSPHPRSVQEHQVQGAKEFHIEA